MVRLVYDQGTWKAYTLFTYLKELKGHEEGVGKNRPLGVEHGEHVSSLNWLDRRKAEQNFDDGLEPTVLILGMFIYLMSQSSVASTKIASLSEHRSHWVFC